MNTHNMNVRREPFDKMKNGLKVVESRLYDEKRRLIQIGDNIIFSCTEGEGGTEEISTQVRGLYLYPDFQTMMSDLPPVWFGHERAEDAISEINQFYSTDDQKKFGVVGIRIKRV